MYTIVLCGIPNDGDENYRALYGLYEIRQQAIDDWNKLTKESMKEILEEETGYPADDFWIVEREEIKYIFT